MSTQLRALSDVSDSGGLGGFVLTDATKSISISNTDYTNHNVRMTVSTLFPYFFKCRLDPSNTPASMTITMTCRAKSVNVSGTLQLQLINLADSVNITVFETGFEPQAFIGADTWRVYTFTGIGSGAVGDYNWSNLGVVCTVSGVDSNKSFGNVIVTVDSTPTPVAISPAATFTVNTEPLLRTYNRLTW